jgi:pimeloyl-ACP methyl ester carboxylesterase
VRRRHLDGAPLARVFTVHRISRRVGLASGTTMEDLANDYAVALDEEFGEPVNVLGISTGGSLAMQLAADRPELVSRLVVAGTACRLSEHGRSSNGARLRSQGRRRGRDATGDPSRGQRGGIVTPTNASQRVCGRVDPAFVLRWSGCELFVRLRLRARHAKGSSPMRSDARGVPATVGLPTMMSLVTLHARRFLCSAGRESG